MTYHPSPITIRKIKHEEPELHSQGPQKNKQTTTTTINTPDVVAHSYHTSIGEAETGRFLWLTD